MATSSFSQDFTIKTEKGAKSFYKILDAPQKKSIEIERSKESREAQERGDVLLKQLLSRQNI